MNDGCKHQGHEGRQEVSIGIQNSLVVFVAFVFISDVRRLPPEACRAGIEPRLPRRCAESHGPILGTIPPPEWSASSFQVAGLPPNSAGCDRSLLTKKDRHFEIGQRRQFGPLLTGQDVAQHKPAGGLDIQRHRFQLRLPAASIIGCSSDQLRPPKLNRGGAGNSRIARPGQFFQRGCRLAAARGEEPACAEQDR